MHCEAGTLGYQDPGWSPHHYIWARCLLSWGCGANARKAKVAGSQVACGLDTGVCMHERDSSRRAPSTGPARPWVPGRHGPDTC